MFASSADKNTPLLVLYRLTKIWRSKELRLVKRKKIVLLCADVSQEVQMKLCLIAIITKLGNVDFEKNHYLLLQSWLQSLLWLDNISILSFIHVEKRNEPFYN